MAYYIVPLEDMIEQLEEHNVKQMLLEFSCPQSLDVEFFLQRKAIEFSKQGLSKTHLVFTSFKDQFVLIGYFTLCQKTINVYKQSFSSSLKSRLHKFMTRLNDTDQFILPVYLIGQIGKNFTNGYDHLIRGNELLELALAEIRKCQLILGGKVVYLECQDKQRLIDFYTRNGFVEFGKRKLDSDEIEAGETQFYLQFLKYS